MNKEVKTLAERLDWLLENSMKPDGTPFTYRELGALTEKEGYRVDAATIGRLRHGQIQHPSLLAVRALARVFGLSDPRLMYDDEFSEAELERDAHSELLSDPAVQEIAFRSAADLNEGQRAVVLQMLRVISDASDK